MGMAVTVTADTAMEAMAMADTAMEATAMEAMAITVTEGMAMEVTVTVMAIMAITTVITPIGTTITGTIITGMATVGGGAGAGMAMGLEPAGLGRRMAIGGFATKFSERRTHYQTASGRASWVVSFLRCVPTELQRFDHFGVTQHQGQKQLGAHHDNEPEIPR
jgi:hypothetical protein